MFLDILECIGLVQQSPQSLYNEQVRLYRWHFLCCNHLAAQTAFRQSVEIAAAHPDIVVAPELYDCAKLGIPEEETPPGILTAFSEHESPREFFQEETNGQQSPKISILPKKYC